MTYHTILYRVDGAVASITLDRPDELNTIVPPMPDEIESAVRRADADDARIGTPCSRMWSAAPT